MVPTGGFEPPSSRVETERSDPLSHVGDAESWCRRQESNLHGPKATAVSERRVYRSATSAWVGEPGTLPALVDQVG